jgi:hypothetical protein
LHVMNMFSQVKREISTVSSCVAKSSWLYIHDSETGHEFLLIHRIVGLVTY